MIKTEDAIATARALIGTPYSEIDCINLIKRVIRTAPGGVEITEGEYTRLLAEIREKAALVDRLYSGEITLAEVPTDWQGKIQRRVDERIAAESWWQEHVYRSTIAANVYTPDQYATG